MELSTLKLWSKIIDRFLAATKLDILRDYLLNVNFSSYLRSKAHELRKRIKSFQRICFIVHSGRKEQYLDQLTLKQLFRKIKEVLQDDNVHPNLIILILLSIRIFISRLRQETLDVHFKFLWNWIVFLLENMIQRDRRLELDPQCQVVIAALKVIELLSCQSNSEFNIHKWQFVYEQIGV